MSGISSLLDRKEANTMQKTKEHYSLENKLQSYDKIVIPPIKESRNGELVDDSGDRKAGIIVSIVVIIINFNVFRKKKSAISQSKSNEFLPANDCEAEKIS